MKHFAASHAESYEKKASISRKRPSTPSPRPTMATFVRWCETSKCWRRAWRRCTDTRHGVRARSGESAGRLVEIFPGLDRLYRERNSATASTLIRTIDKDAGDFLNWVHWNNASLFTHNPSIRRFILARTSRPRHDGPVPEHRPPVNVLDTTLDRPCCFNRQCRSPRRENFSFLPALPTANGAAWERFHRGKTGRVGWNQQGHNEGRISSPVDRAFT